MSEDCLFTSDPLLDFALLTSQCFTSCYHYSATDGYFLEFNQKHVICV